MTERSRTALAYGLALTLMFAAACALVGEKVLGPGWDANLLILPVVVLALLWWAAWDMSKDQEA